MLSRLTLYDDGYPLFILCWLVSIMCLVCVRAWFNSHSAHNIPHRHLEAPVSLVVSHMNAQTTLR